MIKKYLLFVFQCCAFLGFAQNDTTLMLEPERLGERDLLPRDEFYQDARAISGTRALAKVNDLPFRVWVITAEDILNNGYVTLADVLKAVPGMRVSQPGSAVEGEMFMYRGMSGNQHMKIMINDLPVKATVSQGFAIGAQLPIRQAERIEILFGPATAIYGDEAAAGVVNIILKESERPLYTQAHLSFGNQGYNNIDVSFGGKLGRDRKIFRFSIYGSSTVRNRNDLYNNNSAWGDGTSSIIPFGIGGRVFQNPNFYQNSGSERLSTLSHESRLLGLNMKYRGLRLSWHRMSRNDHSALGMNPLASTPSNPGNLLKETSDFVTLTFQRNKKRWKSLNALSLTRYAIDGYSSATHILPHVSTAALRIFKDSIAQNPQFADFLVDDLFTKYASGQRFSYANGFDVRLELRYQAKFGKRVFWSNGAVSKVGGGFAQYSYLAERVKTGFFEVFKSVEPLTPESSGDFANSYMTQLEYNDARLKIIGGVHGLLALNDLAKNILTLGLSPRLGIMYQMDSFLYVRANYSTGIRTPPIFAYSNSYSFWPNTTSVTYPFFSNPLYDTNLQTEQTNAMEASVYYATPNIYAELGGFQNQVYNKLSPGHLLFLNNQGQDENYWLYGYQNQRGLSQQSWGLFGLIRLQNIEKEKLRNRKKERASAYMEYFIQYFNGFERLSLDQNKTVQYNEVANAPRWINQFRWSFNPTNRIHLVIASTRMSSSLSKSAHYRDLYRLLERPDRLPRYRTWDMTVRWALNKNFAIQAQVLNLFDKEYAGLDATGTTDDAILNAQHFRLWRIGANYNMDR